MEELSNKAEIDALVKDYKKELKNADSTKIQSLTEKINNLKSDSDKDPYRYFLRRYIETASSTSKPEVPASAAPKSRILGALAPPGVWPEHVPKKVTGGKSRRRRNKKGKKKTNKRRRN
jgi:hypothetical protein